MTPEMEFSFSCAKHGEGLAPVEWEDEFAPESGPRFAWDHVTGRWYVSLDDMVCLATDDQSCSEFWRADIRVTTLA